jgi:hypothetical protein
MQPGKEIEEKGEQTSRKFWLPVPASIGQLCRQVRYGVPEIPPGRWCNFRAPSAASVRVERGVEGQRQREGVECADQWHYSGYNAGLEHGIDLAWVNHFEKKKLVNTSR